MMKIVINFALVLVLNLSALCCAQQPSALPPEMLNAWKALRAAVLAENVDAAIMVTHFSLKSIDFSHKEVESASAFKRRFTSIFEPKLVELIKSDQIYISKGDPGYEVDCAYGYMILGFEKYEGEYRFSYFGSINE